MIKDIEVLKTEVKAWRYMTNGEVDIWIWERTAGGELVYITKRWNENGSDYWGFLGGDGKETRVKFVSIVEK